VIEINFALMRANEIEIVPYYFIFCVFREALSYHSDDFFSFLV
jgi:hypothetical protein